MDVGGLVRLKKKTTTNKALHLNLKNGSLMALPIKQIQNTEVIFQAGSSQGNLRGVGGRNQTETLTHN